MLGRPHPHASFESAIRLVSLDMHSSPMTSLETIFILVPAGQATNGEYVRVLVTGGSGFVGSHAAVQLLRQGHEVTNLDPRGQPELLTELGAQHVKGDIREQELVAQTLGSSRFDAVMHFAGLIQAGESVQAPMEYFSVNVAASINLMRAALSSGIGRVVFSSSAAVYGNPLHSAIAEDHRFAPISPYGRSKAMVEEMLSDLDAAHALRSVSLRYFNAAGASAADGLREAHEPETHLIPLAIRAALDPSYALKVFGDDYPTSDGTCVRDFVHVADIAAAHLLALDYLDQGGQTTAFNLGSESGFTVLQVLREVERAAAKKVKYTVSDRRAGDPATLIADSSKARNELGWQPSRSDLASIVEDAVHASTGVAP